MRAGRTPFLTLALFPTALLILLVAALALPTPAAAIPPAITQRDNLWVPDGDVETMLLDGTTLYIGGTFGRIGPMSGGAVVIDSAGAGSIHQPYPMVAGTVYAARSDGAGGWYIGGQFNAVGGQARTNLAHFDASGNVLPWSPTADGIVRTMSLVGSTMYVGGEFTHLTGVSRAYLGAVDASTGALLSWNPSLNNFVNAIWVVQKGSPVVTTVYTAGGFSTVGGVSRSRLASIDGNSAAVNAWNPNANQTVNAISVTSTTVYCAGDFTTLGGSTRNHIGAVDLAGNVTAWDPNADSFVRAMTVVGSTAYVGGQFGNIGGQARNCLAAISTSTGLATAWDPGVNAEVYSLTLWNNKVYVGGAFGFVGGQPHPDLVAIDASTGAATGWAPRVNGPVTLVSTLNGSSVLVGGQFASVAGVDRLNAAAIDLTTGMATAWNPSLDGTVRALALDHGKMYVGGSFGHAGGLIRQGAAALDTVTGAVLGWHPTAIETYSLAVDGNRVYISGGITGSLARADTAQGLVDATWNPQVSNFVQSIAIDENAVYAVGTFNLAGGQSRLNAAALDKHSALATAWNPSGGACKSVALGWGNAYVLGNFGTIGGASRNFVAQLDTVTGNATAWNANLPVSLTLNALGLSYGVVYVGGLFDATIGGQPRSNIAAFDASTGAVSNWSPSVVYGPVNSILASHGTVFMGGNFGSVMLRPHAHLAAVYESAAGVGDPSSGAPRTLTVAPNPFRGDVMLRFALSTPARTHVTICDPAGRLVRRLDDATTVAGAHALRWDGRDAAGRTVGAGLYFVRVDAGGEHFTGRVLRMR